MYKIDKQSNDIQEMESNNLSVNDIKSFFLTGDLSLLQDVTKSVYIAEIFEMFSYTS